MALHVEPDRVGDERVQRLARGRPCRHAVVQELRHAGGYVFTGGMEADQAPVTVAADGAVASGTYRPAVAAGRCARLRACPRTSRSR
jgi:hypothetical protein